MAGKPANVIGMGMANPQTALQAVATQANQTAQSTSGVNLDEEGAKLIQWQQAYTAAGRVISVAESLFTTLLTDIQNG